jgi:hypothetical protein
MKTKKEYLEVRLAIELDVDYVSTTLKTSDLYFMDHVITKKSQEWKNTLDVLKKLKSIPRRITVDLIKANRDNYQYKEMINGHRWVYRGANEIQHAQFNGNKYDFDNTETIPIEKMTASKFINIYCGRLSNLAFYNYIESLQNSNS